MKTIHLGKYFLSTSIIAFLLFCTANAFGAPQTRNCDLGAAASNPSQCTSSNNFMVVSPYWQVDSGSYTFVAVTHSSLSGMASQIGLHVDAITSAGAAYDTAESFTIFSGNTQRLFIVPTGHSSINATSIPTAKFMTGTSDFTYGSVRVRPVMSHPNLKYGGALTSTAARQIHNGDGFRDITMLSYWGSVIIEANTTGFAMEFLGDMNDSIGGFMSHHHNDAVQTAAEQSQCTLDTVTTKPHGVVGDVKIAKTMCGNLTTERINYEVMSTGPNLQ
jgi:hypothetical protein